MHGESILLRERCVTLRTHVRLVTRVDQNMPLHVGLPGECSVTTRAAERFHPQVSTFHVDLHVISGREPFPTKRAHERFRSLVLSLVMLEEIALARERDFTQRAMIYFVVGVRFLVSSQRDSVRERFTALSARVLLRRGVVLFVSH